MFYFFLIFFVSWAALLLLVYQADEDGADPDKILRGIDMYGRICGKTEAVKDQIYAAWPNPEYYDFKICVSDCAETNDVLSDHMYVPYETKPFTYYCVPKDTDTYTLNSNMSGFSEALTNAMSDLYVTWDLIAYGAGFALIFTYLLLWLLQKLAGVLVFLGLSLIAAGGLYFGYGLQSYGVDESVNLTDTEAMMAEYGGYTIYALVGIFLIILLALRRRIQIAIEVVEEGSKAVGDMRLILMFPMIPFLFLALYLVIWIIAGLWIYSVSELEDINTPANLLTSALGAPLDNPAISKNYVIDQTYQYYGMYHLFHLLWVAAFVIYFNFLVAAGATADWYFTRTDEHGKKRGDADDELAHSPIKKSCGRTCRYHIGTVALCALIIAIVQFIRIMIEVIEKNCNAQKNKLQKILFNCVRCCLKCLECCLDKVNKNALIWTAIYGDNFSVSACSSFQLLWANMGRVAAINVVSSVLLTITKYSICLLTTGVITAVLLYVDDYSDKITSPFGPAIVMFIISYVIASLFMQTFHGIIDCIFLCFLVDESTNAASDIEMFAPPELQKLVGQYQKQSEKLAEKYRSARENKQAARNGDVIKVKAKGKTNDK